MLIAGRWEELGKHAELVVEWPLGLTLNQEILGLYLGGNKGSVPKLLVEASR